MCKLTVLFFVAMMLTVRVSAAYAEADDHWFEDQFGYVFLNPQPLPP